MQALYSKLDLSVNFPRPLGQEARYVRRADDTVLAYLSSHTGCSQSCRHCWLTALGQTSFDESSTAEMFAQADQVLSHYSGVVKSGRQPAASRIHFNWMARGEPLASSVVRDEWRVLSEGLLVRARDAGIHEVRLNISTIVPRAMPSLLEFEGIQPVIFYSLYSMDGRFRRRWLPKARAPEDAFAMLSDWQRRTEGELVLHWAFIEGENDGEADMARIVAAVKRHGLRARFNLVRYNPFSEAHGKEPAERVLGERLAQISVAMLQPGTRMVPRVGFDVAASCGMFIGTRR